MRNDIEIYIDGQLVDVSEATEVTLEIRSNFLSDVNDLESNRSWTIELPKTMRNLAIMGTPNRLGTGSKWAHQYHECEIRLGGIPIVTEGRATLDSCEDGIAMVVYWGLFKNFIKLQETDMQLNELPTPVHVPYAKNNKADAYTTFTTRGYGYAEYNEMQIADQSDEWKGWDVVQYGEVTTLQPLTDGKIRTGTETGVSVSGEREEDENYKSCLIRFTIGQRAQVNGIVGQGEYRAYALLDAQYNVLDLAEEPKSTLGGDIARAADFRTTNTGYPYLITEKEAVTVTHIAMRVQGRTSQTTIAYGYADILNNTLVEWGTQTVAANFDGILEWDVEKREKPVNTYLYFTQTQSGVITGYNVTDGTGTYGEWSKGALGLIKNENKSLCVSVTFDTATPKQTDYTIRPTSDTAWLIVNADWRYSRNDAVVKVFGTTSIAAYTKSTLHAIQPSVTCTWLLGLIRETTGVNFLFPTQAQADIDRWAIPIISNATDEGTWTQKNLAADIAKRTTLGTLSMTYTQTPDWLEVQSQRLKVTQPCTARVEVIAYVDISTDGWEPASTGTGHGGMNTYITSNDYIRLAVHHADNDTEDDTYIIGASTDAQTPEQFISATDSQFSGGIYSRMLIGNGNIDFEEGDEISMEFCNDAGTHKGLKLYDGTLTMQLEEGDQVPYGGNYPIGINLPEVKVLEFVKFLCLLTGTFPKQLADGETDTVEFVSYDRLSATLGSAYDWSGKLIAATDRNEPRKLDFTTGDWCRHNRYTWKEDEQTRGSYDGDLELDCDTLEYEREAWELPFAATDANRIPIRTANNGSRYAYANRDGGDTTYQYKACKPRFMSVVREVTADGVERAALTFDIDLARIFRDKYETIRKAMQEPHRITERLYLTGMEIHNFDETRPIYLRQYGQYFIAEKLTVSAEGWTEAQLLQIND